MLMTTSEIAASEAAQTSFAELGLAPELLAVLKKLNFHTPTDIQRELIPHALRGRDCLGQAKTGTGKTAAFALPMLQQLEPGGGFQGLVLVPTRELALQVDQHVRMLGENHPLKTLLVYGGTRIKHNLQKLKDKREIVVGTPGRVLDLIGRGALDLSKTRIAVLDEVDRMLDIGFRDDIRRILRQIKGKHQTIFVSATVTDDIRRLARTFMHEPVELDVSADTLTVDEIQQDFVSVHPQDKYQTLLGFLRHENPKLVIVFTNTKHAARRVAKRLKDSGINCKEIHGDLDQRRRERVMKSFRSGGIQVLVATDLASRGLDVMEISHIVNYDVPEEAAAYVHRVGRTARMGHSGYAVTFVTPEQGKLLTEIEKLINKELHQHRAPWAVCRPRPEPVQDDEAVNENGSRTPARFGEALQRDAELDASGVKPVPRTLGSRFRSARRRR
jgi:ATP-dependent RNA helicase DeaD